MAGGARNVGAVLAAVTLLGLVLADIVITDSIVLAPLFALAPLIACAVLPATPTATFAAAALLAAVGGGLWNDTAGSPQHLVRVFDVARGVER